MSKGLNPIAQTYFVVSNIQHEVLKTPLDYSKPILTWLPDGINDKGKGGISLQDLERRLNSYNKQRVKGKINNSGFLKGLYTGYYIGENCTTPAPYLCFDIDVSNTKEKQENTHLLNPLNNEKIFIELSKVAVICWRSNSGNGIAGLLYVPQLEQYTNENRALHKTVGESITNILSEYLHKTTGVDKVTFDPAQSKFRQVRLIAKQTQERLLNPTPFVFTYEVEEKTKKTPTGVIQYREKNHTQPTGSIFTQFDNDNRILDLMLNNGFSIVSTSGSKTRVKHLYSKSVTTGEVDTNLNIYFNYSESLGGSTSFTPSTIECKFQFGNDWKDFAKQLYSKGYKEKSPTPPEIKTVSKSLKDELQHIVNGEVSKIIFKHCFNLQHATTEAKKQFIADNCTRPEYRKYFVEYLKLADYQIKYNKRLTIEKYVSEVLPGVLQFVDVNNRVILRAETGKGKTTAFVRDFHKHRPNSRLLILAPLTIIVEQNAKEYKGKGVFLTGKSSMNEKIEALKEKIVFATYEQGIKLLDRHTFDYIVIDEIHQLLTANSFKRDVISELTPLLKGCKLIGLTGTPTQIFSKLDFKLLDIDVKHPKQTEIELRYSNAKPFDIAINHLAKSPKGKTLIRLNEIETIHEIIKQLISTQLYKESEILFLFSTKEIKNSKDYLNLAHERYFFDNYKLIFTTSLIDEGLSIEQAGFSDVIFIETNYSPRPEPIKQYFARFRNEDPERKNYLYLRKKNNQEPTRFYPETLFDNDLLELEKEPDQNEAKDVLTTYNNLFSNNQYYYSNATVNPYFLAYAVTQVLFKYFNADQFLEYLETNYNLSFAINESFEVASEKSKFGSHTKELKQKIALLWIEKNEQILQVLHYHTQSPQIRNEIDKTQTIIDPEVLEFATANIKHFEQLFKRNRELVKLKVNNPLEHLINSTGETPTLQSNDYYNKTVLYYRIKKTINNPKTKADQKTVNQLDHFVKWCIEKQVFSYNEMKKELKKIGVLRSKHLPEVMVFDLLECFGLDVKRNKKTNLIKCTLK